MFEARAAFSGFSVSSLDEAKRFYTEVLGLELISEEMGLSFRLPGGGQHFMYEKGDHQPANFTVMNFVVANIDQAVDALQERGVTFERYSDMPAPQDEKGILRGLSAGYGPDIAWFKDPAGNVLAVLQDTKSEA